ncbi:CHAT domain-containing protein [Calothrix sp. 336/3]|uniref:CHAT domain-containing protein n=1 Tax=Calothrix sp. 336/3 TaxID=1337936 RepID=UPI0005591E31|nr:tetratricopeptide repeat protein [Calothrix sp. 336/3]
MPQSSVSRKSMFDSLQKLIYCSCVSVFSLILLSESVGAGVNRQQLQTTQQPASNPQNPTRAEAEKLTQEGLQLFQQGTKESLITARGRLKAALILWQKVGDKERQAFVLVGIGAIYNSLGEKQKALEFYNPALPLLRAVGDRAGEATILTSIGSVYNDLGEKQKALEFFQQALSLRRAVGGGKGGEATTLNNIGLVYDSLGETQKALEYYNQALPLYRAVGDRRGEATTLNNIGLVYDNLGEKQKALEYYNQALPLRRAVGERRGEATTLNNIGAVYNSLGEKQKARSFYNQALPLYRAVGDRRGEATTLNNIGTVYNDLGEKQKALEFYNQALPLYRAVGNHSGETAILNNIGAVYNSLGEKQKALEFYNLALPLFRAVGDRRGEATTLTGIGLVYDSLGEKQKALEFYNQALPLRRAVGDHAGEATTLNNIGLVYNSSGEKQKALEFYNQALPLIRAVGDRGNEAATLNNIGGVYDSLGEKQKARSFYNQALPLRRAVGDRAGEANTRSNIATLERRQGNLQASLKHIETAIQIIEELRGTYTDQDLKTQYFATVQGYYKFYIDLLMELHKKDPSQGYNVLALNTSERSRARGLIELLAQSNAKLSKNTDTKLLSQEQELQIKRQTQEKNLAQLVNQPQPSQNLIKKTEAEIQNIINQQKALQTQIRQQNPERDKITNPQPLTLPQIQQQLDKDTVLLQYSLGQDRSFLWLVTPTSMISYELPKEADITKVANRLHTALGDSAGQTNVAIASATELSQLILTPVKDKLAGKRLVIVADGILQQIPFAALHDLNGKGREQGTGNRGREIAASVNNSNHDRRGIEVKPDPQKPVKINTNYQPLVINHEIVNLPSASTIAIQREKTANRKPAPKKIAILADPVFGGSDDNRVVGKPGSILPDLEIERSALNRSAKSLQRNNWNRLPYTASEAQAILKLFPQTSSLQAFSFDANYNWATSKNLNQYQILHFATHGFVNPDQPELSGIVLSLLDQTGKQIPGYLRLADLFEQDYPAELIVLSACETGLGKNVSGEGLVGLTRGLMYAGAERVALSLWKVNDEGTSVLMQEFYKQMLTNKLTPVQALRAAQKQLWQGSQWRSPHYWAAFTLQGEWR